ncbi:coiled-coil domain-containing protein [Krasilnikovia sp. M28-CT-15]|uniref:coiled-coil domain-containing protein n=1 Tax=Krasilnikovia sp. M28-CT-15 TaxID=3373540 RepID=UPI003877334B
MRHTPARRLWATLLALMVLVAGPAVAGPAPASAAPRPLAAPGDTGDDGEGGSKSLIEALESASRGFTDAKDALARSKSRQVELTAALQRLDTELGPRQAALDEIVAQSYRTGRLGPMTALLTASDSGTLLDRADTLQSVAVRQDAAMRDLKQTRDGQAKAKLAIDATIRDQQKQLNVMARRKAQAEAALKAAGGGQDVAGPSGGGSSTKSATAPRNLGTGCTVDDPTTTGCITPRLQFAMGQAKSAGFTHFVKCFRHQSFGEHPKGRACDFAADKGTFGGVASGASRTYGDRLANYFIDNADRIGVLYVIWFRRIWLPSSGWKAYTRGNGDPSSDHTNHVHLSVR